MALQIQPGPLNPTRHQVTQTPTPSTAPLYLETISHNSSRPHSLSRQLNKLLTKNAPSSHTPTLNNVLICAFNAMRPVSSHPLHPADSSPSYATPPPYSGRPTLGVYVEEARQMVRRECLRETSRALEGGVGGAGSLGLGCRLYILRRDIVDSTRGYGKTQWDREGV